MNKRSLGALVALNLVLVIALAVISLTPLPAKAQLGGGGDYLMIAAQSSTRKAQKVVYILDARQGRIAAVIFNSSNNTFQSLAGVNLLEDFQRAGGGSR